MSRLSLVPVAPGCGWLLGLRLWLLLLLCVTVHLPGCTAQQNNFELDCTTGVDTNQHTWGTNGGAFLRLDDLSPGDRRIVGYDFMDSNGPAGRAFFADSVVPGQFPGTIPGYLSELSLYVLLFKCDQDQPCPFFKAIFNPVPGPVGGFQIEFSLAINRAGNILLTYNTQNNNGFGSSLTGQTEWTGFVGSGWALNVKFGSDHISLSYEESHFDIFANVVTQHSSDFAYGYATPWSQHTIIYAQLQIGDVNQEGKITGVYETYQWKDGDQDPAAVAIGIPTATASPGNGEAANAGAQGDPQFTGLQGQSFQVHGIPDEYFSLISHPNMQLNSKFAYISAGSCDYNNTACWTHPGTYNSELGFMFPGVRIHVIAGSHADGCDLLINGKPVPGTADSTTHQHDIAVAQQTAEGFNITLTHTSHDTVTVATPLFTITAVNSDMFFNLGVEMHDHSLLRAGRVRYHFMENNNEKPPYPQFPLHGFVGITWMNARYGHDKRMFPGSVEDYLVQDGVWGTNFPFNQYRHNKHQHKNIDTDIDQDMDQDQDMHIHSKQRKHNN